jgi:acetyl esterase
MTIEQLRHDAATKVLRDKGDQRVTAAEQLIDGPACEIPARLYVPPTGALPRGLLVYYHGGGWVSGDLDTHDGICRDLASRTEAIVLAVGYRLAPEYPFPSAVEDAWAAFKWAHENVSKVGADPARIAVAGESAGANLAAVVALMARDAGLSVRLQLLVYPLTDFSRRRPSVKANGEGYLLTEAGMDWFEGQYAPDRTDWRASPILAPDHRGVAQAIVLTCEFDPLRDEGDEYAATLADAGVQVTHCCYPGLIHGSFGMTPLIPAAHVMMDDACAAIRDAFKT